MQYLSVKNLEKYYPSYKDRKLTWCKAYFSMINSDHDFEMLCEIDKWRFLCFIMLELQHKKPIPLNEEYLSRKGFDFKKRPMSLTLEMLHTLTVVCTQPLQESTHLNLLPLPKCDVDRDREIETEQEILLIECSQSELEKTIESFKEMRKAIKKPITEHGIKLLKTELNKLAGDNEQLKIEILNKSIMNCWQGVFPLSKENNQPDKKWEPK